MYYFDQIACVADDKIVDAMVRVDLEDAPKSRRRRSRSWLRRKVGFLGDSGSQATHSFHHWPHFWLSGRCRLASRQDCSASAAGRTGLSKNCLVALGISSSKTGGLNVAAAM